MPVSHHAAEKLGVVPSIFEPLRFWIEPDDGPRYEVDLRQFVDGARVYDLPERIQKTWSGDFEGRPAFAYDFARVVCRESPASETYRKWLHAFRTLFRFLQSIDCHGDLGSVLDLTEAHGVLLKRWIEHRKVGETLYGTTKTIVDRMRAQRRQQPLLWPARNRDEPGQEDAIEHGKVRALYRAVREEGRKVQAMFAEGEALANAGTDPRGAAGHRGSASWEFRENHAWLVRELRVCQEISESRV